MNPGELETLIALLRSVEPRGVLEFGVNVGRTAKAILANVPGIDTYQGIDVTRDYVPAKKVQRNEVPTNPGEMVLGDPRFELIVRPRGSLDLTPDDLEPCDAAFIDGDHGHQAVLHDTELARELVRPGGIIVWHDYHSGLDRDGSPAVDVPAVLDKYFVEGRKIFHVENTWLAFERV